jgi:U4/U6 small nuclear ribonucleoprotein PRP31
MSLADALLADLDGLSDGEAEDRSPSPPPESSSSAGPSRNGLSNGTGSSGGKGAMLPPPLPMKAGPSKLGNGASQGVKRSAADPLEDLEGEDDVDMDNTAEGQGVGFVPEGGVRPADELDEDDVEGVDMTGYKDVGVVAKLHKGRKLKEVLEVGLSPYARQGVAG